MLLVRDVPASTRFFNEGLGLGVSHASNRWCELDAGDGVGIAIKEANGEAECTAGYTPVLSFDVDDLPSTVSRAIQLGASLDGPIKYPIHGKVAALRSPDGHMIGLFEPSEDLPEVDLDA